MVFEASTVHFRLVWEPLSNQLELDTAFSGDVNVFWNEDTGKYCALSDEDIQDMSLVLVAFTVDIRFEDRAEWSLVLLEMISVDTAVGIVDTTERETVKNSIWKSFEVDDGKMVW